ncbi:MAG: DUF4234 domain-containing protein [Clostridia bacterium]|nr:DUF4234 domain-containing protein [Clostridia bacterium]
MQKRSIPVCIILSIITCGIYGIYWFVCLTNEANTLANREGDTAGGVAFLLTLITCNIYGIYWAYKMGEKLEQARTNRGMQPGSSSIVYLLLHLFGLGIIGYALMQSDINALIDAQ